MDERRKKAKKGEEEEKRGKYLERVTLVYKELLAFGRIIHLLSILRHE
jgi:hypothetical protein